jgi:hypothetical protein
MQLAIKNTFKNPAYIKSPTDSMTVATYSPNEQGKYDELATGVVVSPALVPNDLTDLVFAYTNIGGASTSAVYSDTDRWTATFSPYAYFRANGGNIRITFPKGSLILKSTSLLP